MLFSGLKCFYKGGTAECNPQMNGCITQIDQIRLWLPQLVPQTAASGLEAFKKHPLFLVVNSKTTRHPSERCPNPCCTVAQHFFCCTSEICAKFERNPKKSKDLSPQCLFHCINWVFYLREHFCTAGGGVNKGGRGSGCTPCLGPFVEKWGANHWLHNAETQEPEWPGGSAVWKPLQSVTECR